MTDGAQVTEHRPLEYKETRPIKANLSCHFCGKVFSETLPQRGYVYPIANEPRNVGGLACTECYLIQFKLSVDLGLIIPYAKRKKK
jgi:hypothetical protein